MAKAIIYIPDFGLSKTAQENVLIHELGHALGYAGHSENNADVMFKDANGSTTLSANETNHLKQIYDRYSQ